MATLTWKGGKSGWATIYRASGASGSYSVEKTGHHKHTQNWRLTAPNGDRTRHSTLKAAKAAAERLEEQA